MLLASNPARSIGFGQNIESLGINYLLYIFGRNRAYDRKVPLTVRVSFESLRPLPYNRRRMEPELVVERLFPETQGQGVLRLRGPLTYDNLALFQNAIRRETTPTLILDLSDVPYIDSAGLGSLVGAYVSSHKAGQQVVLTGVNERVANLFQITKVEPLFLTFPSLEDALQALTTSGQA